ncbi:MAG: phytanoyl-CoA dioxygenase family protein [Planctomycetota bacterium]|nr:phytanoyl-CoA dioxygenase family protein [Planctomycetota bacterium]
MSITAVARDASLESQFATDELAAFQRDGFIVVPQCIQPPMRERMLHVTLRDVGHDRGPVELEADLRYPGAPRTRMESGGRTPRRLKLAHSRDEVFTEFVMLDGLRGRLQQILGPRVAMPLSHHNCIMTKQPHFSSDTGWHQDIRYWSFERPDLVSVWVALGREDVSNGALKLIPGSHVPQFDPSQFDDKKFFRRELDQNKEWLDRAIQLELDPGDVLFFHCRLLHAASRNFTESPKFSVVFTFRAQDNPPLPGTRSSAMPEMLIPPL